MEEIEAPVDHLHEHINEEATHSHEKWMVWVALSTAFLAVLAAIASLLANHHSEEAMICQIKSSDQWSFYQAKSIKSLILLNSGKIIDAIGKVKDPADVQKIQENKLDQNKILKKATTFAEESSYHVAINTVFARSVTIFQIAIAISAITILTKRKFLWIISLGFTVLGIYFLIQGLLL